MNSAVQLSKLSKARFPTARALFEYLEAKHGFVLAAPVDLDSIAALLGIEIDETLDLSSLSTVGKISLTDSGATIWINPLENSYTPRRRFTLAHELGHFCLHLSPSKRSFIDKKKAMSSTESYWDLYESEANNFAAALLMPEQLVILEGKQIIHDFKAANGGKAMPPAAFTDLLARRLHASTAAVECRLADLGVVARQ